MADRNANRKGHILILVQNLPVPMDRRVWMESTALTEAGYKVSVISPCPPDERDQPHRVIDGISVYRYKMPPQTKSKASFVYEFYYCLRKTAALVRRVWNEDPFDVIQTCNPPDTFWTIARKYKTKGVGFVFDHHDLCPELYESKFNRRDGFYKGLCWLEHKQFKTADAVIATNESYKAVALSRGAKREEDVTVVRSGPSLADFKPVKPEPDLKRGFTHMGVYLGVMGVQDGVDYALRAIRFALDQGMSDTCFTFVGKGDEYQTLVDLKHELGLDQYVHFTGRIPDDELKRYLSTADLGLAPDPKNPLNDVSTMNKMIEYMAMGLPIVSFDLVESRRSAEEAAIYVADDDEQAMGKAMIELLADPDRRARMSRTGLQRVQNGLSWDTSRAVLVNFYDRLMGVEQPMDQASVEPAQGAKQEVSGVAV